MFLRDQATRKRLPLLLLLMMTSLRQQQARAARTTPTSSKKQLQQQQQSQSGPPYVYVACQIKTIHFDKADRYFMVERYDNGQMQRGSRGRRSGDESRPEQQDRNHQWCRGFSCSSLSLPSLLCSSFDGRKAVQLVTLHDAYLREKCRFTIVDLRLS
uniref:Secreted protein n=1 Tax=Pseudo-nitzschia australis TaxID=44445 RepID=A0A7S4ARR4_9STRA